MILENVSNNHYAFLSDARLVSKHWRQLTRMLRLRFIMPNKLSSTQLAVRLNMLSIVMMGCLSVLVCVCACVRAHVWVCVCAHVLFMCDCCTGALCFWCWTFSCISLFWLSNFYKTTGRASSVSKYHRVEQRGRWMLPWFRQKPIETVWRNVQKNTRTHFMRTHSYTHTHHTCSSTCKRDTLTPFNFAAVIIMQRHSGIFMYRWVNTNWLCFFV